MRELRVSQDGKGDWLGREMLNESNEAINESYKDNKINLRINMSSLPFYIWISTCGQNLELFGERQASFYALTTIWVSWATQHRPLVADEQSSQKALLVLKSSL